jgi:hypothetical protein
MDALRKHLKECRQCKGALSVKDADGICHEGVLLLIEVATECANLISLQRKAFMHRDGVVFACPDLSRHGATYVKMAKPLWVTGVQGELF